MVTESEVQTKDDLERRNKAWKHCAEREDYRCAICGQVPPYGEREIYFESGLCGFHAHTLNKDD
ncbi:MAG: hypothetical protein BRD48_01930 [Bacteroidetes bacterium QS_9_68_14]|nr:MAG: hypothetical protein BRD48_01930 [Bacteroidetes bacterium QS_9_68_14]